MHLEDTLVMFGVYNVETLEKLIKTVHTLHNRQSMYESLFTAEDNQGLQISFMEIVVYNTMPLTQCSI